MKGLWTLIVSMLIISFWVVMLVRSEKCINKEYTLYIVYQNGQKDTLNVSSGRNPYLSDGGSIYLSPNGHINESPTITGVRSFFYWNISAHKNE